MVLFEASEERGLVEFALFLVVDSDVLPQVLEQRHQHGREGPLHLLESRRFIFPQKHYGFSVTGIFQGNSSESTTCKRNEVGVSQSVGKRDPRPRD